MRGGTGAGKRGGEETGSAGVREARPQDFRGLEAGGCGRRLEVIDA
jgi:hypothetical protein